MIAVAIRDDEPIRSMGPSKPMAFSGIPRADPGLGVRTIVSPPAWWIASNPREPSSRDPESTTPIADSRACRATERKRRSIVRLRY